MTITSDARARVIPRDALGRERLLVKLDSRAIGERRDDSGEILFTGHAAVFDQRTWIGPAKYGFYEQVDRAAFNKTLSDGADVRFLINHDPSYLLARTKAGTLDLATDKVGLVTTARMIPTSYALDLAMSLEAGNYDQMSFGFETLSDSWETLDDGNEVRTLLEVKLFDVSVVTYPAYEGTDAAMRAKAFDLLTEGFDEQIRSRILRRVVDGLLQDEKSDEPAADSRTDPPTGTAPSGREDATPPATTTGARNKPTQDEIAAAVLRARDIPGKGY